jgi:mono/diheme cytochrome c family protein
MNDYPISRKRVFLIGTGVCAVLSVLAWVYIPEKQVSNAESITFAPKESQSSEAVPEPQSLETAGEPQKILSSETRDQQSGASIPILAPEESYKKYCAQCHGADGQGDTPMARMAGVQPTNLKTGPYKFQRSVDSIAVLIQKGNGSSMPGFGSELGAENSRTLAQYVLALEAKETPK